MYCVSALACGPQLSITHKSAVFDHRFETMVKKNKTKNSWLFDCTRSEELKRVPVNEIRPPEFRVPPVQGEGTHALAEGNSLQRLVMWGKDKDVFWVQMLLWCRFVRAPTHQAGRHPGIPATEAGLLEEVLAQRKTARSLQTPWWHQQTANERLCSKQYRDFLFARLFSEVYVCLPLSGYCKNMVAQYASAWRRTSLTLITRSGMFIESYLFDKSMINFAPVKLN